MTARRARSAVALALLTGCALSGAALSACGATPPPKEAPPPSAAAPPPPASGLLPSAAPPAASHADAPTWPFDRWAQRPVLDDPRLAAAKVAAASGAHRAAAAELRRVLAGGELSIGDRAAFHYQLAVLLARAGDPAGAAAAFEHVAETSGGLSVPARIEAAALRLALGQPELALRSLARLEPFERRNARLPPLLAEAHARAGDPAQASAALGDFLAKGARPAGWATTSLRIVRALGARPGQAREAARLARAIAADAQGAAAIEAHALAQRWDPDPPRSVRARLAGATAKLRAGDARAAVAVLDRLAREPSLGADACDVLRVRAEALGEVRRRAEAAEALADAVDRCAGRDDAALVIFQAGRAFQRIDRWSEAATWFERLEGAAPEHRLADDARVERVRSLVAAGDLAAAAPLAAAAAAAYPRGDVVADAPFAVALAHMVEGRWASAGPLLEAERRRDERSYDRRGRFAYFAGRVREALGDPAGARAAWEEVLAGQPAGFYGALAHGRLEELAAGAGRAALARAAERALRAPPLPERPYRTSRGTVEEGEEEAMVTRAAFLASVGDVDGALGELDGLGLADRTAPPWLRWAAARLVAPVDPARAHLVLRGATESEERPGVVELSAFLPHAPVGAMRAAWEIAFPRPFAEELGRASAESGVPEPLLFAIMREESAFAPAARSRAGALGLLQLMPATAAKMARPLGLPHDEEALRTPAINARLGARFLAQLRRRFPHAPALAVPAYNAGPLAVERWCRERPSLDLDLWIETIPYRETRLYTKRVLGSLAVYEALAGAGGAGEAFRTPRRACPAAAPPSGDPSGEAAGAGETAPDTLAP